MTPENDAQRLSPGAVLAGRYRLERRIAAGGMASVWLAHDGELDRPVAVKVLSDLLAEDPAFLARFRREAQVAARLSHPNLVRVFDFSGEPERPYLVMEYVEGGTLAERIAAGTASELDPGRLAGELLGALAHIHAAGIVHRDVKPSNVLIDREGRARLTDFGIAQPEDATRITRTGEVIGTLRYMAPEVLDGGPATPRSDLYSCGIVLRDAVTKRGSPQLDELIDRLTAPGPDSRPASAREALDELAGRGLPATEPAPATPSTERGRAAAGVAAAPAGAGVREIHVRPLPALLALAGIGLVVLLLVLLLQGGDEGGARPESAHRPPRTQTTTTTQTTTSTTSVAVAPPQGRAAGAPPSCAALAAQRGRLDERQKAAEERLKEDPEARKQAHETYEARKHRLDEQLKSCEEEQKAAAEGD